MTENESPSARCRVVAVANQKGGVGKTTTAINVATSIANVGRRVLLIDLDPQGNLTSGIGLRGQRAPGGTVYEALLSDADPGSFVAPTSVPSMSLIPTDRNLTGAEIELVPMPERERRLKRVTDALRPSFDYVFIDCPPSLGLLTVNALAAGDGVVVPVQCEYYALEGLAQLLDTIEAVRERLNEKLEVLAIVLTMEDRRNRLSMQVIDEVRKHFPQLVARARIPRTVRLAEAPSHGKPISVYDPQSRAAKAYAELARELMTRLKAREPIPLAGAIA